jgi:DNA-binding response OmpR family regulator
MDGVETLRRLGSAHPELPIYVVTGFYTEYMEPLGRLRTEGFAFDVARKPLELGEIRAIADAVLAGSARERSVALVGG